jgi:hypothetical protein
MLYLAQFLSEKLTFYGRILKPTACVVLVRKAADEIRTTICFQVLQNKETEQ